MEMDNAILRDAGEKIRRFNRIGLHYNLVAGQIYQERYSGKTDPFSRHYLQYIVAGLISFDVGRMMGSSRYEFEGNFFASRLERKLETIRVPLDPLMNVDLPDVDLDRYQQSIMGAWERLSVGGKGSLNQDNNGHFHVGATKVLHFLNPELFIMVDSNAAKAFRKAHNIGFRKGSVPGYRADRYWECMRCAQRDIRLFGTERFQALEPSIPLTRIYDKLTFVTGLGEN